MTSYKSHSPFQSSNWFNISLAKEIETPISQHITKKKQKTESCTAYSALASTVKSPNCQSNHLINSAFDKLSFTAVKMVAAAFDKTKFTAAVPQYIDSY